MSISYQAYGLSKKQRKVSQQSASLNLNIRYASPPKPLLVNTNRTDTCTWMDRVTLQKFGNKI